MKLNTTRSWPLKNTIETLAGQYFDQETGLHYNWHRSYNPGVGRYVTADPSHTVQPFGSAVPYLFSHVINKPQELNQFNYTLNNPTNGIDSMGLLCISGITGYGSCMVKCLKDNPIALEYSRLNSKRCTPLYISCVGAAQGDPRLILIVCKPLKKVCQAEAAIEAGVRKRKQGYRQAVDCHTKCKPELTKCDRCQE